WMCHLNGIGFRTLRLSGPHQHTWATKSSFLEFGIRFLVPRFGYFRARFNCSLAAFTTESTVKPNFFNKSFSGTDAPKERMPMLCPVAPTYFAQPKTEACSTETRAVTFEGKTRSR